MSRFKIKGDPLLTAGKVMLVISEIVFVFTIVVMLIAIGAVLIGRDPKMMGDFAEIGMTPANIAVVVLLLASVAATMLLCLCLVVTLKRIVDSVADGDPFLPINADRLSRMGWYALAAQIGEIVIGALGEHLARSGAATQGAHGIGFTGLALAIVLFILARVFRRGTELREELEGTV